MKPDRHPDPGGIAGLCFLLAAVLVIAAQVMALIEPEPTPPHGERHAP